MPPAEPLGMMVIWWTGSWLGSSWMTGLVIGGELLGVLGHHAALFLGACDDLQHGFVNGVHADEGDTLAGREESGFVQQVLQVCAGEACGGLGDGVELHILGQGFVPGVDPQDLFTALDVGQTHIDLSVETAGTQEGGVQDVGAVGSCQDDDTLVGGETVHFYQQLVQGLFAFVVTAAQTGAALAAHSVDLVNKDDGGGLLLGLIEEVADTGGAHAHIQLHEVGAGDRQELHAGLAGHSLGQQGLTGTRRAHQQHALGDPGAQGDILLRIPQEIHDFP